MGYLDLGIITLVDEDGNELPKQNTLKVTGATLADDPDNAQTLMTVIGGTATTATCISTVAIGDVLCSANDPIDGTKVTKAIGSALVAAGSVKGIALSALSSAPGTVTYASAGTTVSAATVGLSAGAASYAIVVSFRAVRKTAPTNGDLVVGTVDEEGNLHVNPYRVFGNAYQVNVIDFGATGQSTDDVTVAFQNAAAVAGANTADVNYPNFREMFIPAGAYNIGKPIRIKNNNVSLRGAGFGLAYLRPSFKGPTIIVGPDMSDVPMVTSGGPFGGNCMNCNTAENYHVDLTRLDCDPLDVGVTSFTFEEWVYITSTITAGDIRCIAMSSGVELSGFDTSVSFLIIDGAGYGSGDNMPYCEVILGGVKRVLASLVSLSLNTWHHVAIDYDGSHLRLLVDGAVTAPQALASMTLQRKPWETLNVGNSASGILTSSSFSPITGKIGPVRFSSSSKYGAAIGGGSTYTVPSAAFPTPGPTDFFVANWDMVTAGDVYGALSYNGQQVWIGSLGTRDLSKQITGVSIRELSIYANNGATAGGIQIQLCTEWLVDSVSTILTRFGLISENNSFESLLNRFRHLGSGWCGIINNTTAGDVLSNSISDQCSYPYVLQGGASLIGMTVGAWQPGCAGILAANATFSLSDVFWDSETQVGTSRGALLLVGAFVETHGLLIGGTFVPGQDIPAVTAYDSVGYLGGQVFGAATGSEFVVVISPPATSRLTIDFNDLLNIGTPMVNDVKGNITVPYREMNGFRTVPIPTMAGGPNLTFVNVGSTGDTITRSAGSWLTDGFRVGDIVTVSGSVSNNVTGVIVALTATVLTFGTTALVAEGPSGGISVIVSTRTLTMDEWTFKTLTITGTTTATVLVPPMAGYLRNIRNTTGNTLTLKAIGGSTTVAVASTKVAQVSADGTDCFRVTVDA